MIISDADLIENTSKNKAPDPELNATRFAAIYPSKGFYIDHDTMEDNSFIDVEYLDMSKEKSLKLAQAEFNKFTTVLKRNGIQVEVFDQENDLPDSVCTDWFMTIRNELFPKGVLVLGAMKTEKRRKERS